MMKFPYNNRHSHKNRICRKKKGNQKGFTLVELLVVMAVLGIVCGGVIGFLQLSSHYYRNITSDVDLQYEAQLAVNLIENLLVDTASEKVQSSGNGITISGTGAQYTVSWEEPTKRLYYTDDAGVKSLMTEYVSGFSIEMANEGTAKTVVVTIDMEKGKSDYHMSKSIYLRNQALKVGTSSSGGVEVSPPEFTAVTMLYAGNPVNTNDPPRFEMAGTGLTITGFSVNKVMKNNPNPKVVWRLNGKKIGDLDTVAVTVTPGDLDSGKFKLSVEPLVNPSARVEIAFPVDTVTMTREVEGVSLALDHPELQNDEIGKYSEYRKGEGIVATVQVTCNTRIMDEIADGRDTATNVLNNLKVNLMYSFSENGSDASWTPLSAVAGSYKTKADGNSYFEYTYNVPPDSKYSRMYLKAGAQYGLTGSKRSSVVKTVLFNKRIPYRVVIVDCTDPGNLKEVGGWQTIYRRETRYLRAYRVASDLIIGKDISLKDIVEDEENGYDVTGQVNWDYSACYWDDDIHGFSQPDSHRPDKYSVRKYDGGRRAQSLQILDRVNYVSATPSERFVYYSAYRLQLSLSLKDSFEYPLDCESVQLPGTSIFDIQMVGVNGWGDVVLKPDSQVTVTGTVTGIILDDKCSYRVEALNQYWQSEYHNRNFYIVSDTRNGNEISVTLKKKQNCNNKTFEEYCRLYINNEGTPYFQFKVTGVR